MASILDCYPDLENVVATPLPGVFQLEFPFSNVIATCETLPLSECFPGNSDKCDTLKAENDIWPSVF